MAHQIKAQKYLDVQGFDVVDQLFEPIDAGDTPAAATGLIVLPGGADLADLLAPLSVGAAIDHNTHITSGGIDLAAIFAAKGSRTAGGGPLGVAIPSILDPVGNSVSINATVSGGTPPYSFSWYGGGDISNPTQQSVTVSVTGTGPASVTVHVDVTDANNNSATSNACHIYFNGAVPP